MMADFDFLPRRRLRAWRRRRRVRAELVIGALAGVLAAAASAAWQARGAHAEERRHSALEHELAALSPRLAEVHQRRAARARGASQASEIAALIAPRVRLPLLLSALSASASHGVVLTKLRLEGASAMLAGYAVNPAAIGTWAGALERSTGIASVDVAQVKVKASLAPDRSAGTRSRTSPDSRSDPPGGAGPSPSTGTDSDPHGGNVAFVSHVTFEPARGAASDGVPH